MNRKILVNIMIECWNYSNVQQFTNKIQFLTLCMYHTQNEQLSSDIEDVIYYLIDKQNQL